MSLVESNAAPQLREGADLVLEAFLRHQVKHVFIFPGGTIVVFAIETLKRYG